MARELLGVPILVWAWHIILRDCQAQWLGQGSVHVTDMGLSLDMS